MGYLGLKDGSLPISAPGDAAPVKHSEAAPAASQPTTPTDKSTAGGILKYYVFAVKIFMVLLSILELSRVKTDMDSMSVRVALFIVMAFAVISILELIQKL